jgi:hypothetical protein
VDTGFQDVKEGMNTWLRGELKMFFSECEETGDPMQQVFGEAAERYIQ